MPFDNHDDYITLSMLNSMVRETIQLTMPASYWVQAEVASLSDARGHCYMELVEKSEFSRTPVAQARACCWESQWYVLSQKFARATGMRMQSGMKVLLNVKANFHVAYGFSWIVTDVDPSYTMGDMARRRQEILQTLRRQGVIDNNKQLPVSPFARRIAVVSSATAAGYGDFCNQLSDNEYGFAFTTRLFPAVMQGEQVEESIISALDRIYEVVDEFDVVVIIRGGGSNSDLSGFDTLSLAENVANFSLPIITGIGHDRDQSVLDVVARVSVKTPTAAAAFLIDNLAATAERLDQMSRRVASYVTSRLQAEVLRLSRLEQTLASSLAIRMMQEHKRLDRMSQSLSVISSRCLHDELIRLERLKYKLFQGVPQRIEREKHRLEFLNHRVCAVDPVNILRRGYSIAMHNGRALTSDTVLHPGDDVDIVMHDGVVHTVVK